MSPRTPEEILNSFSDVQLAQLALQMRITTWFMSGGCLQDPPRKTCKRGRRCVGCRPLEIEIARAMVGA